MNETGATYGSPRFFYASAGCRDAANTQQRDQNRGLAPPIENPGLALLRFPPDCHGIQARPDKYADDKTLRHGESRIATPVPGFLMDQAMHLVHAHRSGACSLRQQAISSPRRALPLLRTGWLSMPLSSPHPAELLANRETARCRRPPPN